MTTEKRYIDSFRDQMVSKAIQQGFQIARVADETGISKVLLGGWVLNHIKDALAEFEKADHDKAIKSLQASNTDLKRENELLKKMLQFMNLISKTS